MFKTIREQNGQSVVEIVVAITLFAIVFTGGWQIIHNSYQGIIDNMNEMRAHYYVIEGFEVMRGMRNEDWNFLTVADESVSYQFQLVDGLMVLSSGSEQLDYGFTREIYIESVRRDSNFKISSNQLDTIDPDTKMIRVKITWQYLGKTRIDESRIYLTNWNKF